MTKKILILVITLGACFVFGFTLVHALYFAPEPEVPLAIATSSIPAAQVDPREYPDRFEVPSLSIDTHVQHVGVTAAGNMGVPNNFTDVGWYKYGVVPGYRGSAVIDGHVDNGLALAGVFKHLGDIKVGDDIYVTSKEGTRLHFRVQEVQSYDYKSVPLEKVFSRTDRARLNLITCEGNWVKAEKTYDKRLVVYTVLVS